MSFMRMCEHIWQGLEYLLKWAFTGLFFFIFVFSTVNSKYVHYKIFADALLRAADLWYQKQLLCQLSHNHCPTEVSLPHTSTRYNTSNNNTYKNQNILKLSLQLTIHERRFHFSWLAVSGLIHVESPWTSGHQIS